MRTKLSIFAFGLIPLLGHAAEPEATAKKPPTFYVHAGSIKRTYSCAAGVEAGYIQDGVVHANLRRGDDRFLLIGYSEESRPNHPNGRCGAGIESYLVWLHVHGSSVLASQSAHYESCWRNIEGGPPEWSSQFCVVQYERFLYNPDTKQSSILRSKASFDSKAPEKGLQIAEQPPELLK